MRSITALVSSLAIFVLFLGSGSYGEEYTADYWLGQANNYYSDGSYDIALLSVNKSLEIDPTNIEAWKVKGDSFYALGMYKDALDCYNKLTQLSPYDTKAYNSKAKALLKLGNYKDAITSSNKSLEINPLDAEAWTGQGNAFYLMGQLDCTPDSRQLVKQQYLRRPPFRTVLEIYSQELNAASYCCTPSQ